jgi:FMN reductase
LVDAVKGSVGFVLASPVYKATYAGGLKAIVDLIPPDALVGKPALGIATTKLREHGAEAERAYRALFAFFRASTSETAVVLDDELHGEGSSRTLAPAAEKRLEQAAQALIRAVDGAPHASASS